MNKYLYFAVSAPNSTEANEQVVMMRADRVSHFEMQTATRLDIHFTKEVGQVIEDADAGDNNRSIVALDITSGKHKEVLEAIAGAMNAASAIHKPMIVIADSENNEFVHIHITACVGIDVIDRP